MPGAAGEQGDQGQEAAENQNQGQANQQGQGEGQQQANQGEEHPKLTLEEAEAEIKKLRKENASRRTANKSLEERMAGMEGMQAKMRQALGIENEQEISPEERIQQLQDTSELQALSQEVMGIAYQKGVPHQDLEYFEFLFAKKLESLEEGEELTDEDIDAVVQKSIGRGGQQNSNEGGRRTGTQHTPPNPNTKPKLDAAMFAKMNMSEQVSLYEKNPDLYQTLFSEAKTKGLLAPP